MRWCWQWEALSTHLARVLNSHIPSYVNCVMANAIHEHAIPWLKVYSETERQTNAIPAINYGGDLELVIGSAEQKTMEIWNWYNAKEKMGHISEWVARFWWVGMHSLSHSSSGPGCAQRAAIAPQASYSCVDPFDHHRWCGSWLCWETQKVCWL